ncbi:MAG: hypothetical protein HYZ81_00670 [Nitrospinae bacterium]|nr:hypothetical protein [Nitrospinota bacterium]
MSEHVAAVHLRKDHEKRLLLGHVWVFSNEVAGDLSAYEPGSLVDVYSHGGTFVGRGYINPHSLITVRLLTPRREAIDGHFFAGALRMPGGGASACSLRWMPIGWCTVRGICCRA